MAYTTAPATGATTYTGAGARRAYNILHFGFVAAPLIAGVDKFTHILTNWDKYLAPVVAHAIPAHTFMMLAGVIEVVAALVVAFAPRFGGYLVAVWLWGIIVNLLLIPGYYDVALRDFGLSLGALALAFLAQEFHGKRVADGN